MPQDNLMEYFQNAASASPGTKLTTPSVAAFQPNQLEIAMSSASVNNPFAAPHMFAAQQRSRNMMDQYTRQLNETNALSALLSDRATQMKSGDDRFKTAAQYAGNFHNLPGYFGRELDLGPGDLSGLYGRRGAEGLATVGKGLYDAAQAGRDYSGVGDTSLGLMGMPPGQPMTPPSVQAAMAEAGDDVTYKITDSTGLETQVKTKRPPGQVMGDIQGTRQDKAAAQGAPQGTIRLQTRADRYLDDFVATQTRLKDDPNPHKDLNYERLRGSEIVNMTTDEAAGVHIVTLRLRDGQEVTFPIGAD
ncbi:hypothetical protein HC928_00525 [bacterium]|nr:hypothetical protein [bacterium]